MADSIEFCDDPNVPQFFADGLHDVEVREGNCEFVLFAYKRTTGGVLIKQAPFTCIMPITAVGPAIALTLRKTGSTILVPAAGAAMRDLFTRH